MSFGDNNQRSLFTRLSHFLIEIILMLVLRHPYVEQVEAEKENIEFRIILFEDYNILYIINTC
jgi:hypothetical protein